MKKTLLIAVLFAVFMGQLPLRTLAQSGAFTVQGRLSAKTPPTTAYLYVNQKLDSATVQRGRFTFKSTVNEPGPTTLLLARPGRSLRAGRPQMFTLYLEPGTVRVFSPDSLAHAVLAGTPLNLHYQRLRSAKQATSAQLAAIEAEWNAAAPEKKNDKAYKTSVDQRQEGVQAAQDAVVRQFIRANPTSLVSLYALMGYDKNYVIDPVIAGPLFAVLAPALRQSKYGRLYGANLEAARKVVVGAVAPDFTQNDPAGKPVRLSDFRGKYVLVDFWASWCGPCRQENPNVVTAYNQYKGRNFAVLGVSLDQPAGRTAWLKAIEADGLRWPQVSELKGWDSAVVPLYGVSAIPFNLLLDPDGHILAKNLTGDELGKKLAAVLPATTP